MVNIEMILLAPPRLPVQVWARQEEEDMRKRSALISLTTRSPVVSELADKDLEKIIIYMAVVLGLFLLLILFFVIFTSWWRKVCREKPRKGPAYTLEQLRQMHKKNLLSEAEYRKLRQKTLEEMAQDQRPQKSDMERSRLCQG